ncbi:MAG: hypothetical protein K8T91_10835 [Planctomycetes bacterium]|nr:hypothetical protein [Planctomycetota bacterium]
MQLVISPTGSIRCVYGEEIDLAALGSLAVTRGSHVEPNANGAWCADLAPVGGPVLGPFPNRSQALAAEQDWLAAHWLVRG